MLAPPCSAWAAALSLTLLAIAPACPSQEPPPRDPAEDLGPVVEPKIDLGNPRAIHRLRNRASRLYYIRAGYFLRKNDLYKAVVAARKAVWYRSTDPALHVRLGEVYERAGLLHAAIATWTKAIKINPHFAPPHALRAQARVAAGEPAKAVAELDWALDAEKGVGPNAWLLQQRGLAHEALGNLDRAAADLTAAIELDPERPESHAGLASVRLRQDASAASLAEADKAIALKRDLSEPHVTRAMALERLGRGEQALASYATAIELDPDQAEAYLRRGDLRRRLGLLDQAAPDLSKAAAFEQYKPRAYFQLGQLAMAQGDAHAAVAQFTEALRVKPDDAVTLRARASAWISRNGLSFAVDDASEAIRLDPRDVDAYTIRSTAALKRGHFQAALADAQEAVRLRPDDPLVWNAQGAAHQSLGDWDQALADYDRAVRLKPDSFAARTNRAGAAMHKAEALRLCQVRQGPAAGPVGVQVAYWNQALTDLDAAERLRPGDPRTRQQRVIVSRQLSSD